MGTELSDSLGIDEQTRVRIRSAHDVVEAVAVRVPGMPVGIAAISLVPGGGTAGRWARLIGKDPRLLWGNDPPSIPCAVEIVRSRGRL
jgi:hypothetical protein